jgi:hypothetical protein
MRRLGIVAGSFALVVAVGQSVAPASAAASSTHDGDARVTNGSPSTSFPRNKQNEPAVGVALNPNDSSVLASGSNEEIDNAPCNGSNCSFTPGVSDNGIYFSFNSGASWKEPTYTGWSARTGTSTVGPIGTVPWFYESGLVGDGDPALTFGPKPGPHGFSWDNGSRLYYSSLTSNFPGTSTINGQEGIAVSRTDNVHAAAAGDKSAWMSPVVASKDLRPVTFSDKEEIWADNAATSSNFGNVYLCWTSFGATTAPIVFARSTDGGTKWSHPVTVFNTPPTSNGGSTSCTIRTDSHGTVYVLWEQINTPALSHQMLARSYDGGRTFETPRNVANVVEVGKDDPVHTANHDPRFTFDGIAGARTDSGLQVDIANGAPSGRDATNQMVMTWSDGRHGLNHEVALVETSRDYGGHWSIPVAAQAAGDRPDFPAIAISPNGRNLYLTYDAFRAPWRSNTTDTRPMQGVVRVTAISAGGEIGDFHTVHRGDVGDARASSENNLCCEFLGDYNYVVATRSSGTSVWNDVRDAQVCPAMNAYRQSLITSSPLPKPSPATDCPARFGNSDIYGGTYPTGD